MSVTSTLRSEPVRLFLYPTLLTVLAYFVVKGVVTEDWSELITGVLAALVGVPVVEGTRSHVVSPETAEDVARETLRLPVDSSVKGILSRWGIRV